MKKSPKTPSRRSALGQAARANLREDGIGLLEWMLDYELQAAARYRRFASLVMVSPIDKGKKLVGVLKTSVRRSDECFDLDESIAILMGETDTAGAQVAVERIKSLFKNGFDLRFAVVSYPVDGRIASELLWTAHRRLDKAKKRQRGTVVTDE